MATARPADIDELFECPVCYEKYEDPRSLRCAHQFCLKCLERLVIKKPGEQDKIICPSCRHETPIKSGEEARHLPRPVLMNEVQSLLKNLLDSSKPKKGAEKYCESCEDKDTMATKYCYQCHQKMCDSCLSEHEEEAMFEGHKSVDISDSLFCQTHDNIVTAFCHDCKTGICSRCAVKDHKGHKNEDIQAMAAQSRDKIKGLLKHQLLECNPAVLPYIKSKVKEVQRHQENIVSQIDDVIDVLKLLASNLEESRNEVLAKTSADISKLNEYETDLTNMNSSKTSLLEFGQYLIEKASDPELVLKAMKFPAATAITAPLPTITVPAENQLWKLKTELSKLPDMCRVSFKEPGDMPQVKEKSTARKPITALKLREPIKVVSGVRDIVFNQKLCQLAVKTLGDKYTPIKVYDLSLKGVGKEVEGLDEYQGLYIDHHRDLYIALCGDCLTTIDMQGKVRNVIKVKGRQLHAVTYCGTSDQYIVTDRKEHRVFVISAKSGKVVNSFGSKGSGDDQFKTPLHVCTGDIRGRTTIVVSDYWNHAVKLFDLSGQHVKTYGSKGSGDGQLHFPRGVAVDPAGRVIACDSENKRLVAFWTDGDGDHWQCLMSCKELNLCPIALDLDPENKLVAVRLCSTSVVKWVLKVNNDNTIQLYTYD